MASRDDLWFELGVRDNVTNVLTSILAQSNEIQKRMKSISDMKPAYENALKIEQIYDKIAVALRKIEAARGKTSDIGHLGNLDKMKSELERIRDSFSSIADSEIQLGVKGQVAFDVIREGLSLALSQTERYTKGIDDAAKAAAILAAEEEKARIAREREDARYNEVAARASAEEMRRKRLRDLEAAFSEDDRKKAEEIANQQKVEEILQMRQHKRQMEQARFDRENAQAAREVTETLRKKEVQERRSAEVQERHAQSAQEMASANRSLMSTYYQLSDACTRANSSLSQLNNMLGTYVSVYGVQRLLRDVINIGGQFEFQHRALQNILGDLQEANTLFSQLKELAVESPKTFMELTTYTKQLSAYQIPADELFDTTKRLADLSTGLGVDMSRLILAYGQVRSAAVLRGQELRQFTEASIPIVQALADRFTKMNGELTTTADVFKLISQRAVPFEMVRDILWEMTDEGGRFHNMQEELADTLYGRWQKLQDQWQIMLGNIASANTMSGKFMRTTVDGLVSLTAALDTLLPTLGMFGLGRLASGIYNLGTSKAREMSGATAIGNMELAKMREANRLERERVMYGRQLNAYEQALVATKGRLVSREYALLAASGELSRKTVEQLIREGKIHRVTLLRLAAEQGIAREKMKQMTTTQLAEATGLLGGRAGGGIGAGIMGFFGGPVGLGITAATTAIGLLVSALDSAEQKAEELSQKGDAMADRAQQNANGVAKALSNISADGTTEKRISVLEKELLELGRSGEAVVDGARKGADDLEKRIDSLKDGAENLKVVLELLGSSKGKALFEKMIEDSGIEDMLKSYERSYSEMAKYRSTLERYSESYKKAISEITKGNEDLRKQLAGKNLYEQIEAIGQAPIYQQIYGNRKDYGLTGSAALTALSGYFNRLVEIENKWKDIAKKSIPEMREELLALARESGISTFDNLSAGQRQSLELLVRQVVNSVEQGGKEAKDKLAEQLAKETFNITIVGNLKVDKTELSEFAQFVWSKFGGNVMREGGQISIGGSKRGYSKEQVGAIFGDPAKAKKDLLAQKKEIKETAEILKQAGDAAGALELEKALDDINKILNALNWNDDKGGSKTDKRLEDAKLRLEEVKDFYSEYKKYRDQYGREKGLDLVTEIFGIDKKRAQDIVGNYEGVLKEILESVPQTTDARKKFALGIRKLLGDIRLDDYKDVIQRALRDAERFIQEQTSKWNLYKSLLDKTGDKSFARTAFTDGVLWDDMTRGLEARLRELMSARGLSASGDLFGMDAADAERFFGAGTAELKLWEEIVKGIRKNWSDGLNEVAAATEKLLTAEEKVLKAERELADLRSKYGNNDPRAIAKEQEVGRLAADAFEQSEPYLRFYSAILSMTLDEAEKAGAAIKENLVKQLADGTINADKYLKSIKNVNQQLKLVRDKRSDAMTLLRGGVSGLIDKRKKVAEDEAAGATIQVEAASKEVLAARKNLYEVEKAGNSQAIIAAKLRLSLAEAELDRLSGVAQKKQQYLQDILGFEESMSDVAAVVDMVAGAFDGFSKAAMQVSEMLDALGHEGSAETWSDISDTIGAIGSPISAAANALKSALSGDVGGFISNTVGIFTAPITAFAKLHDKKRQREIEKSEQRVRALTTSYQNLQTAMESALGGIYTSGGYDEMFGNLKKQRDEIQHQMELEDDKKKTDADKMADYRQQLKELDAQIKDYALNMAKSLYDIDLKAWASQLTDAIVSAWENGEDAVEAYRSKVKEIIKDLTKNILAKKVMENAFEQLGIDNLIASMMDASSGKLDETMLPRLAEALGKVGNITVDAVTKSLDAAERQGMIERGTEKTSSASNTIKGISEQTADLLASYINAIRADVSVNRATLLNILYALQGQTEMPAVARAQLQQLEIIATNTGITAENTAAINEIYAILQANVNGINYFRIK